VPVGRVDLKMPSGLIGAVCDSFFWLPCLGDQL